MDLHRSDYHSGPCHFRVCKNNVHECILGFERDSCKVDYPKEQLETTDRMAVKSRFVLG